MKAKQHKIVSRLKVSKIDIKSIMQAKSKAKPQALKTEIDIANGYVSIQIKTSIDKLSHRQKSSIRAVSKNKQQSVRMFLAGGNAVDDKVAQANAIL